jgi:hypothetical protein
MARISEQSAHTSKCNYLNKEFNNEEFEMFNYQTNNGRKQANKNKRKYQNYV